MGNAKPPFFAWVNMCIGAALLLAATMLGGCVTHKSVHQTFSESDTEIITITETTHIVTLGPCLSGPGSWVMGVVTLKGRKDVYLDGEYDISVPGWDKDSTIGKPLVTGKITVDWKRQKITIDLLSSNKYSKVQTPAWLNGTYSFETAK